MPVEPESVFFATLLSWRGIDAQSRWLVFYILSTLIVNPFRRYHALLSTQGAFVGRLCDFPKVKKKVTLGASNSGGYWVIRKQNFFQINESARAEEIKI